MPRMWQNYRDSLIVERSGTNIIRSVSPASTLVLPGPTAIGDVSYIHCVMRGGNGTISASVTLPSGWTQIFTGTSSVVTNTGTCVVVLRRVWKVGDTLAAPAITFANEGTNFGSFVTSSWSGVDNNTPEDVQSAALSTGTLATPTTATIAAITTLTDNIRLLSIVGANNASVTAFTAPSGMTTDVQNTNRVATNMSTVAQAAKGTTGTKPYTITGGSGGDWAGMLIALRPNLVPKEFKQSGLVVERSNVY